MLRGTYTYALMEVSKECYNEIAEKLRTAGYDQAFIEAGKGPNNGMTYHLDMHGVALCIEGTPENPNQFRLITEEDKLKPVEATIVKAETQAAMKQEEELILKHSGLEQAHEFMAPEGMLGAKCTTCGLGFYEGNHLVKHNEPVDLKADGDTSVTVKMTPIPPDATYDEVMKQENAVRVEDLDIPAMLRDKNLVKNFDKGTDYVPQVGGLEDCKPKFNNTLNFRGSPPLPPATEPVRKPTPQPAPVFSPGHTHEFKIRSHDTLCAVCQLTFEAGNHFGKFLRKRR